MFSSNTASMLDEVNLIPGQSPDDGDSLAEVNLIFLLSVPIAISSPRTINCLFSSNFISTPASIVKVTPWLTETLSTMVYGLLDNSQIVSLSIFPERLELEIIVIVPTIPAWAEHW